jgi:hypothetical protein
MKQPKGVDDLAARLGAAAASPLVLSPATVAPAPAAEAAPARPRTRTAAKQAKPAEKGATKKEPADTMQLTIRPTRTLYARYVSAAADRSRQLGRMVSAQEVMLEILEKGEL